MAECEGEQQHLRQYHYLSWPDHGKPSYADPIIRMIEMIHGYRKRLDTPVVVHCRWVSTWPREGQGETGLVSLLSDTHTHTPHTHTHMTRVTALQH